MFISPYVALLSLPQFMGFFTQHVAGIFSIHNSAPTTFSRHSRQDLAVFPKGRLQFLESFYAVISPIIGAGSVQAILFDVL
jgi:hypothetical protein